MISILLAAALFAAGEPAASDAAKPAEAAKADKGPKPNKDGMICRREAVLGSRMKQRVCMTQTEWDQRRQQDRDMVDQAQRNQPLTGN